MAYTLGKASQNIATPSAPVVGETKGYYPGKASQGAPLAQETTQPEEGGGFGGFVKSLISAPVTMVARPFQAGAELLGASAEDVNAFSKKISGGLIAPVPQNLADLKKDIGRGVQTVAFGAAGPVTAGLGLGLGSSLEQGNDLLSAETAFNTVAGGVGGKVLGLIGKPLLDATGKVVGKITPQILKDVASKGTNAMSEFAATHNILPAEMSKALTVGAQKAETIANKPFEVMGNLGAKGIDVARGAFTPNTEKLVNKRVYTLQKLEDSNARIRNFTSKQKGRGFDPKTDIANTDLLQGSVDNTGTIRTKQEGGAISQYNEFIKPQESVVSDALKREGNSVPLKDIEKNLLEAVQKSGVKGASRTDALAKVSREIEGYKLELDPSGLKTVEEITMPVSAIHDAKVDKYANVNYLNEGGRVDKAIAKSLKKLVEANTKSVDVQGLNRELAKHYANIGYLEKLDGAKVEGGRLGKHFAKTIGAIAGGHFGPLGAIAGAELAGAVKGSSMSSTFGRKIGKELEISPLMKKTIQGNQSSNNFGNRKAIQPKSTAPIKKVISDSIPEIDKINKTNAPAKTYIYYHAAPKTSANSIVEKGFKQGDVYVFDNPTTAKMYAAAKGGGKPGKTNVNRSISEEWDVIKVTSKIPMKRDASGTIKPIKNTDILSVKKAQGKSTLGKPVSVPAVTDGEFRYHETSPGLLQKIQTEGLKPSRGMYGKGVYFSPKIGQSEATGRGLLVRSKVGDLKKFGFDEFKDAVTGKLGDEGWAEKTVPPQYLEFSKDGGKTWVDVKGKTNLGK